MKNLLLAAALTLVLPLGASAQNKPESMGSPTRPQAERITHGPVLENVGKDSAQIAWSTDTGGSSVVRYGTDRNNLSQMAESPYAVDKDKTRGETHRVKLSNLKPGTTYYYYVDSGQGQGTGTEAKSQISQFTTKK